MGVRLGAAHRFLFLDHPLVGGQTGLGLGLTRLGARTDPFKFAGQGALAGFGFRLFLHDALGLGFQPRGIVALVRVALAAIQLQRPLGDQVQEVAVVSHQDDAAGEVFQVVLQPGDGFGVQVVGRFVEQQHVRLGQQQASQGDAALFTAGQVGDFPVVGRAAQGAHGLIDAAVDVPDVAGVDLLLKGGHLLHQFVGVVFTQFAGDLVEAVDPLLLLAPGLDVLADVQGRIELGLLLQIAALDAVGGAGFAGELGVQAGHDLQQGRLTRAVDADDADLGVVVEAEPDVLEDLAAAGEGLGQTLHLENILLRHEVRCRPSGSSDGRMARM